MVVIEENHNRPLQWSKTQAIRDKYDEEVKDVKTILHTIVFYDEIIGVE